MLQNISSRLEPLKSRKTLVIGGSIAASLLLASSAMLVLDSNENTEGEDFQFEDPVLFEGSPIVSQQIDNRIRTVTAENGAETRYMQLGRDENPRDVPCAAIRQAFVDASYSAFLDQDVYILNARGEDAGRYHRPGNESTIYYSPDGLGQRNMQALDC